MFKSSLNSRLLLLLGCLVGLCVVIQWQPPSAHAAAPTVAITQPLVNGAAVGHVGTKVHLNGSGFTPGITVNLYTTTNNDLAKCTMVGGPAANGLTPFITSPTTTIMADGTFALDTTWPDNAAIATTAYYICVTGTAPAGAATVEAALTNPFTVAQPAMINITNPNVAPGGQVTITGTGWLPPQLLTVAITPPAAAGVVTNQNVNPDVNGNFSVTLTIPMGTPAGTYSVSVIADAEPTLKVIQNSVITIAVATPTPTTALTATPSPQAKGTPTPPPTDTGNNGVSGGMLLVFTLAGAGVLFVIVGVILFFVYARPGS